MLNAGRKNIPVDAKLKTGKAFETIVQIQRMPGPAPLLIKEFKVYVYQKN